MKNRICPTEETLSEYLCGALEEGAREELEAHLASCCDCRSLIAEAYDVIKRPAPLELLRSASGLVLRNLWITASACFFVISFIYPEYFLQLLTACLITGAKWVMDSRTSRIMVMIREAWRSGDESKAEKIISRFSGRE